VSPSAIARGLQILPTEFCL